MNNLGTIRLETDRLILRKFEENDYIGMFNNWASDSETNKYVSFKLHENAKITRTIVNEWISKYENGALNWIVELKDTSEVIGNIEVIEMSKRNNNCEVGYVYGSKFWGKGYATEALKRVIEYLLYDCDFFLVEAKHHAVNPASGKVMEKAGMIKDGVLRKRRTNKLFDGYDDLVVYSIIKEDIKN